MIQESDKGYSVGILDKAVFIKQMESFLSDKAKFRKTDPKKGLLNFTVNHEKQINEYLKSLKSSGVLSVKHHKKIEAVGLKPGVLYGICEVYKRIVDRCSPFRSVLSAIGTPS